MTGIAVDVSVRVPASTANLGPGFDALGMALSLFADVGVVSRSTPPELRAKAVDDRHPASIAFQRAGGVGSLWVRSPIPMGRGLGFSGAMRVGGAAAALEQRGGDTSDDAVRREVLAVAAELEGHADNAAASTHGGVVVAAGGYVVPVTAAIEPDVVVWVPDDATTSTNASRTSLPATVSFADAAGNVGAVALLVAALTAGRVEALRSATVDRLHQDVRFGAVPGSRSALEAGLDAGAWCGWLSGSGPSVAFLAGPGCGAALADRLPPTGHTKLLAISPLGVHAASG